MIANEGHVEWGNDPDDSLQELRIKAEMEIEGNHYRGVPQLFIPYHGVILYGETEIGKIGFTIYRGKEFKDRPDGYNEIQEIIYGVDESTDTVKMDFILLDKPEMTFKNYLLLTHIEINKQYRGLMLGRFIAQKIIRSFGTECNKVLLIAYPLQFGPNGTDFNDFSNDESAFKALINYYKGMGFKRVFFKMPVGDFRHMSMKIDFSEESPYDRIPVEVFRALEERTQRSKV